MDEACPSLLDTLGFLKFPDDKVIQFTDTDTEDKIESIKKQLDEQLEKESLEESEPSKIDEETIVSKVQSDRRLSLPTFTSDKTDLDRRLSLPNIPLAQSSSKTSKTASSKGSLPTFTVGKTELDRRLSLPNIPSQTESLDTLSGVPSDFTDTDSSIGLTETPIQTSTFEETLSEPVSSESEPISSELISEETGTENFTVPETLIEMASDKKGKGKLSKEELEKLADTIAKRQFLSESTLSSLGQTGRGYKSKSKSKSKKSNFNKESRKIRYKHKF